MRIFTETPNINNYFILGDKRKINSLIPKRITYLDRLVNGKLLVGSMWNKIYRPHSIIVTALIFVFIGFLELIRLNTHFLDPFNHGVQEYEITDIVYTQLGNHKTVVDPAIRLVHIGEPDRLEIARMIDRLSEAGAKVIGLDVMLTGRKDVETDFILRESIKKAGNVVLASELFNLTADQTQFEGLTSTDSLFAAEASLGYVNFPSNHTKTIRYFSPKEIISGDTAYAFSMQVLRQYAPQAFKQVMGRDNEVEKIHYIGNRHSFIPTPKEIVLDSTIDLSRIVKDKIVLMGYVAEKETENPLRDRFYTPLNKDYAGKSIPDMYGVAIHANILSMVLNERYIKEIPHWLLWGLIILFCYANVFFIHGIYASFHPAFHGITRSLQLVECMLLFFLIGLLFYYFRIQIDFGTGILALLLAYDIIMIYESFFLKKLPFLQRIKDNF